MHVWGWVAKKTISYSCSTGESPDRVYSNDITVVVVQCTRVGVFPVVLSAGDLREECTVVLVD